MDKLSAFTRTLIVAFVLMVGLVASMAMAPPAGNDGYSTSTGTRVQFIPGTNVDHNCRELLGGRPAMWFYAYNIDPSNTLNIYRYKLHDNLYDKTWYEDPNAVPGAYMELITIPPGGTYVSDGLPMDGFYSSSAGSYSWEARR